MKVEEIKGYMTIKEAAEYTNTPLKEFYQRLEIPENVPNKTKMKEIKSIVPGYEFDRMKQK